MFAHPLDMADEVWELGQMPFANRPAVADMRLFGSAPLVDLNGESAIGYLFHDKAAARALAIYMPTSGHAVWYSIN